MEAEIVVGDSLEWLRERESNSVDLIVADSPYNIGVNYGWHYNDNKGQSQFLDWLDLYWQECHRVLRPTGSIYVFMGANLQAEVLVDLKLAHFHFRNTVVWHYTFGQSQRRKYTPSWTAIHYLTKDREAFVFNPPSVPSERQRTYGDARASARGKTPDDVWVLNPRDTDQHYLSQSDVWAVSRVAGTHGERTNHVTQLPERLVERIILASSNPGDVVVDPFAGTGTVPLVASRHNRIAIGIELSEQTAAIARQRIASNV